MNKPLNPKWELLLSVPNFVIPCIVAALLYVWLELALGWRPDLSPFLTHALFNFCMPGVVAFSIIGVLLCLFLWHKKGTDAALPLIALPMVVYFGVFALLLRDPTASLWSQISSAVVRFISSL